MSLAKKSFPIILAVLATLITINTAIAAILPESSYDIPAEFGGNSGSIRNGSMGIDYAIYDTESFEEGTDEHKIFGSMADTRYVYAYQIYNYDNVADVSVFSLSFLGYDAIQGTDRISAVEDSLGVPGDQAQRGVDASGNEYGAEYYFDSQADEDVNSGFGFASWTFGDSGSFFDPGDHSFWLILQSNSAPKWGTYSFEEINSGPEVDIDTAGNIGGDQRPNVTNIPEPVTIALLGLGGLILRKTGKKA